VSERTAGAEALRALAEANDSPRWEGWAWPHLSRLAATRGDRTAYDASVERMHELAAGPGQGPLAYTAASAAISAATLVADFAAARRAIIAARVVGETVLPDPAAAALAEMGELGMIDLLEGTVAEAALIEMTYPQPSIDAAAKAWTAAAHLQLGHLDAARADIAGFGEAALRALPRDIYWPTVMAILAGVMQQLGDAERAAVLYQLMEPAAERLIFDGAGIFLGAVHLHLGFLAMAIGHDRRAGDHFEQAELAHARVGADPWWNGRNLASPRRSEVTSPGRSEWSR
jgi:hypothetical protein